MKEGPTVEESLLKDKDPKKIKILAETLGIGVEVVTKAIDKLISEGYGFNVDEGTVVRTKTPRRENTLRLPQDRKMHFGVISDTHLSSKKERLDKLNQMYDIYEREGVHTVFHVGDLTDGYGVYRGQEFELKQMGQQEQVEYAIKNYPHRNGVKTVFITGNHDLRQYERGGIDVGVPISKARKDMQYAGQAYAMIDLGHGVRMEMVHPAGSPAYALSYKSQRDINNRVQEDIPNILLYGHYHSTFYMNYRNLDFLQAGCFKDAGIFEHRLGINPVIGGWLVDATISSQGKRIESFKPQLFKFR